MFSLSLLACLGAIVTPRYVFYFALVLLAAAYGIARYRRLGKPYKLLVQMLVLVLLAEAGSRLLAFLIGNTHPVYHFLTPLHIGYYGLIYFHLFHSSKSLRTIIAVLTVILALTSVVNSAFFQSLYTFPSLAFLTLSLFVISCALLYFYEMLRRPVDVPLFRQPSFWFNCAGLLFYSLTFFVFGFFHYIQSHDQRMFSWGYDLIWIANIVLYGGYFYCLYLEGDRE